MCAYHHIYPEQVDFVMADLQADMRERVFCQFPVY